MRYIGCKQRLLPFIHQTLKDHYIEGETFCDLFAGTATVGHYFKQQGYKIISNDLLYASHVMQQVKVAINHMPRFERLAKHLKLTTTHADNYAQAVIDYLNQQDGIEGFIYQNYSEEGSLNKPYQRRYYTECNARKIDSIRESIEAWLQLELISKEEFYILLYTLLNEASRCANTTGTMSSFLKAYTPQALRTIALKLPQLTPSAYAHEVHCQDSLDLLSEMDVVDILYLDPPYTTSQYAASYHLLETIARWDYPALYGISGKRDTQPLRSALSSKRYALNALEAILRSGQYRHLLMSYSNDSLIPHNALMDLFQRYGVVSVKTQSLKRYNTMSLSDPRINPRQYVEERLYYLKPYSIPNQASNLTPLKHSISSAFQ